jgi:hypothetical protein
MRCLDWIELALSDNTHHSQQKEIHATAGFESAIPRRRAGARPQPHVLDRAATGSDAHQSANCKLIPPHSRTNRARTWYVVARTPWDI